MQQFGDGGLKDEGGEIDEVSGNEVPVGGTKSGVRDDIAANVSKGEFIFPEDVTRFIGLDKLMAMRQDAKMGLKKMDAMGQMGNGDEATMPDDMPFGMADLVVVGGKGEPMELAGGGFIPVEDYTVVQDMIEDRSDKAAAIDKDKAMSDMIADNTTKSAVIDKENEIQNFAPGGAVFTTGQERFDDTGDGPQASSSATTGRKKLTFKEMMGDQYAEILVYSNEAGDKIVVPAINGVPIYTPPPGYTLYVPPVEGEEEVGEPLPPAAAGVIETINNYDRRLDVNGNRKEPPEPDYPDPINWETDYIDDPQGYLDKAGTLVGTGRTIMEAAMLFIPFVGLGAKAMLAHQDAVVLKDLNAKIKAGFFKTKEQLDLAKGVAVGLAKSSEGLFGTAIVAIGDVLGAVGTAVSNLFGVNDAVQEVVADPSKNAIVSDGKNTFTISPDVKQALVNAIDNGTVTVDRDGQGAATVSPEILALIASKAAANTGSAYSSDARLAALAGTSAEEFDAQNEALKLDPSGVDQRGKAVFGGGSKYTGPITQRTPVEGGRGSNPTPVFSSIAEQQKTNTTPSAINKLTQENQTLNAFGEAGRPDPYSQSGISARTTTTPASTAALAFANVEVVETDTSNFMDMLQSGASAVGNVISSGYSAVKDVVTTAAENNDNYNENARRDREAKAEAAALEAQKAEEAAAAKVAQAAEIQRMLAAQQAATVRQQAASNNNNNNNDNNNFTQPTRVSQATRDKINTASDNLDRATGPSGQSTVREDAGITFRKSDNDRGFTGGLYKGGLASKPKSKKKTTNKRGLAARK